MGRYFMRFLMRMAAIDAAEAARAAGRISTPVWTMSDTGCAAGFGSVTGAGAIYHYEKRGDSAFRIVSHNQVAR